MNMINMIITVGQLEIHVQHIQNNQHNLYDQHLQRDQQFHKHNKIIAVDTLSGIHFAPSKRCCFRGPFVNDVPLSFEVSFMCSQATKSAGQTMSSPVSTANPRDISDWSMLTGTCLKCDSLDPKIHLKFHTLVVQAGLSPCP